MGTIKVDPRYFADLSETGMLWLINRTVFHPRGFALALHSEADGTISGWTLEGDGAEPWSFPEDVDDEYFARSQAFLNTAASPIGDV